MSMPTMLRIPTRFVWCKKSSSKDRVVWVDFLYAIAIGKITIAFCASSGLEFSISELNGMFKSFC